MPSLYYYSLFVLLAVGGSALAVERTLPKGEETPFVVEQIYEAKVGELHVTRPLKEREPIRLLLQTNSGLTCEVTHIEGGDHCLAALLDAQNLSGQAAGCSYRFHDQERGCDYALKGGELKAGHLFRAIQQTHSRQHKRRNI